MKNTQLKGISWMIIHCFVISCVVVLAKLLGQKGYGTMQVVFFHSFVAFILLLPVAIYKEGKNLVTTKYLFLHLLRGFLGVVSLFLYFYALKFIPLTDGRAVALFGPVITFIFAVIFFKEKINLKVALALLLSLAGGYIIINPGGVSLHAMSLLILIAMIMWSVIDLIIKKLSYKESTIKQMLYLTGLLSLFSVGFAVLDWKSPDNSVDWFLLILIGVIFLFNSMAIFLAIKYANLTTIMPFDFSGMIFSAVLSFFVFGEIIKINTLIGSVIVFISSLYLIYFESKAAKQFTKIAEGNSQKE